MSGPSFEEIKEALNLRAEEICRRYAPEGRKNGSYWMARNPARADAHAGSYFVRLRAPFIYEDRANGEKGDLIKMIAAASGFPGDMKRGRAEALAFLGWKADDGVTPQERAARLEKLKAQRNAAEQKAAEEDKRDTNSAFALWLKAQKLTGRSFTGSLADVYFKSRGIDLTRDLLAEGRALPGAVRFFNSHDYRLADGGKIALPCLISLMSGADGRPAAVHRIWLAPDGRGKAVLPEPEVNKVRKIWPRISGKQAVIRLSKGDSGITPEEAGRQGLLTPVIITEGVEDGLAAMLACPEHRVWAAGSLGNLKNVPPLPCVDALIVCQDNDWGKPQAQALFNSSIAALRRSFQTVSVARSWIGKDVNDLLAGEK